MVSYIDVTYNGRAEKATVKPQYQYDKGQKLRVHGVSEGVNVFVHYAVRGLTKPVVRIPSLENGAWVSAIPTALLAQSSPIIAYVYLTADDMAQTVYEVEIPIIKRPMPDGFDMTDDEIEDVQGLIAQIRGAAEDAKEVQSIVDELREALKEASAVAALSVNAQSIGSDCPAYADLTKDADGNCTIAFGIPKGASGVQMSNEEPTDPDIDVWINPNGESDFSGGLTDEQIAEAVAAYFKQHPIEGGVTEEQIANAVRDYLQQNPVEGGVNQEQLNQAVSEALAQAKQSGEFKGDKGDPGDDYVLTEEDKREIAEQAAEFVEVPEGGGVEIDDSAPSTDKVYSSNKVDDALSQLSEQISDKLGKTEQAADSAKLGGKDASEYYNKDNLIFDNAPVRDSTNPITSGAAYNVVNPTPQRVPLTLTNGASLLDAGDSYYTKINGFCFVNFSGLTAPNANVSFVEDLPKAAGQSCYPIFSGDNPLVNISAGATGISATQVVTNAFFSMMYPIDPA